MKIIHCADLHIDCKTKFSLEKRLIKRHQILQNFVDLVTFAEKNQVSVILICGDLFEDKKPLKKSLKVVQDLILNHPAITFFYIYGNHDENVKIFEKSPQNFYAFGNKFNKVTLNDICIGGVSFLRQLPTDFYEQFDFDENTFNILLLHAPIETDKYSDNIQLKKFKNIDYLALGHIHKRASDKIGRMTWAYCGCLESVSFSNLGECGFELLEINNHKLSKTFIPFSKYNYQIVQVDITQAKSLQDIVALIKQNSINLKENDIVRIVLKGNRNEELEINTFVIEEQFKNKFFYIEIVDESKVVFDLKKYAQEKLSLKAEFINKVFADASLTEEEKQQICLAGLQALKGEEVNI